MAEARKILGVGTKAGADQIRQAWKTKARLAHPDQPGGSEEQFVALGEAYKLLKGNGWQLDADYARPWRTKKGTGGSSAKPREAAATRDRRGRSAVVGANTPRKRVVEGALEGLCARVLSGHSKREAFMSAATRNGGFYVDPRTVGTAEHDGAKHIAALVQVDQGTVCIRVNGIMTEGRNTVSMPCGTRSEDTPALVRFHAKRSGQGRIRVSDTVRARNFPWARSVEISFIG